MSLPLLATAAKLAGISADSLSDLSPSIAIWALASKLALELVARERVVPKLSRRQGRMEARWAAALSASEDSSRIAALARSMPPAAHAVPVSAEGNARSCEVWAPDALLRAYVDALVDSLLRSSQAVPPPSKARGKGPGAPAHLPWAARFSDALTTDQPRFEAEGFAERSVIDDLARWSEPALGVRDRLRVCFRLELPEGQSEQFTLRFLLQSPDDPSLIVPAADVWSGKSRGSKIQPLFPRSDRFALEALGRAARLFPPLQLALQTGKPESLELDPQRAWTFLGEGAALLGEAGFGVMVPGELTRGGQRRLRLQLRIGGSGRKSGKVAGAVKGKSALGIDELLTVDWQAVVGDESLSLQELSSLAKQKAPLVRHRGAWVAIDPSELGEIQRRLASGPSRVRLGEAVRAALAGETTQGALSASVQAVGSFAELIERLQHAPPPSSALRRHSTPPYVRIKLAVLSWLSSMARSVSETCLPTTWAWARPFSCSRTCCTRSSKRRLMTAPRCSSRPPPCSATGSAKSSDSPLRYGSPRTTAASARAALRAFRPGRWCSRAMACCAVTRSSSRASTGRSSRSTKPKTSKTPPLRRRGPLAR